MKFHLIGKRPSSQPSPLKGEGVSLAVHQWMELVRGERAVQVHVNPFRIETINAEEHYCLHCFGVRWFDVVYANDQQRAFRFLRCRCCGKESGG
jgi:hypothetical protein